MIRREDQFDELDIDFQTKQAARASYIAWRMQDLPGIYQNLLPLSTEVAELWEAETRIRAQHDADFEFSKSPWRRVGPRSLLLDYSGFSAGQNEDFEMGVRIQDGLRDAPKMGRTNDPEVREAMDRAREKWMEENPDGVPPLGMDPEATIKLHQNLSPGEADFAAGLVLPRPGGENDLRGKKPQ